MGYQLGIDLGTTYTAAAVCRSSDGGQPDPGVVVLGTHSTAVASVIYLGADGQVLVGEAAERRAVTDPDRVVRECKRRIGDDIPIVIGGTPHHAHDLAARMISWVVGRVAEREGGPATRIAITHPASWGTHRKMLLAGALRTTGIAATFLAEPQAAAVSYACAERVEPGSTIAVYDLGGGTFDSAVVSKNGFALLGHPEGIDRLGGIDFDDAVFEHVRAGFGDAFDSAHVNDPGLLTAVARLRRECVEAKEALSSDTEVTIPVLLPELRSQARLTRAEFEAMIRPPLEETVDALGKAVASAGLTPADLSVVLLVGGSSRIPLVAQMVSDTLARPVAAHADPKNAIALGAALAVTPQPTLRQSFSQAAVAAPAGTDAPAPNTPSSGRQHNGPPKGAPSPIGSRSGGPGSGSSGGPSGPPHGGGFGSAGGGGRNWEYQSPPREQPAQAAYAPPAVPLPSRAERYYEHPPVEPPRRRPVGLLIGVGGLLAIAAIVGAITLWPSPVPASTFEPLPSRQVPQQNVGASTATLAPRTSENVPPTVTTTRPTTTTTTTTKSSSASVGAPAAP